MAQIATTERCQEKLSQLCFDGFSPSLPGSSHTSVPGFVEIYLTAPFVDDLMGDAIRAESPLGRVARPDEVAAAVLFLASRGAEFCTGTVIDVNGASYLRS